MSILVGKLHLSGLRAGSFSEDRPGVGPRREALGRGLEWPAAEATAASGGNRKPRLGQRPAGCTARSRATADAGSRNPYFVSEEKAAGTQTSTGYFSGGWLSSCRIARSGSGTCSSGRFFGVSMVPDFWAVS